MNAAPGPTTASDLTATHLSATQVSTLYNSPTAAQTRSGDFIDLLNPHAINVRMDDMAEHLAKINRYVGASLAPISVAQHSVHVSEIVEQRGGCDLAKAVGLLHDGEEAYMGDLITPLKAALRILGAGDALERITMGLRRAVFLSFGLPWPVDPKIWALVKQADLIACATEKRDQLVPCPWGMTLPAPASFIIRPWSWAVARDTFKSRARQLGLHTDHAQRTPVLTGADVADLIQHVGQ